MTTQNVYYPHAIQATAVSGGAELFCLTLLDDVEPGHNFQDLASYCAAEVGPQEVGSHLASPSNSFSTPQLATLLTAIVAGDFYVCRNLSAHYVDMLFRAGSNLGTRMAAAGTNHLKLRAAENSLLCVESITAAAGQLASARCRLTHVLNSQTGADPLVPTAGVALSGTASGRRLHTLGPISVNGVALQGVTSVTLDNNLSYDEVASDGDSFPSYVGIKNYAPRITIQSRNTGYLATYGTRGTALSSLALYLRSKLAAGINEVDASAFHILFSATTGVIKARRASGDRGQVEITIDLAQSGPDTAAYTIAVNEAIS